VAQRRTARRVKIPLEQFVEFDAHEGEDPEEYREMREAEERAALRWCLRDRREALARGEVRDV
jgi:hypothetical protein